MESSIMRLEEQEVKLLREEDTISRGKPFEEDHSGRQAPEEKQSEVQSEEKDIIIKCNLEEMIKAFFKDYVIVWHDPNLNSEENKEYLDHLRRFCQVLTFTDWQKAAVEIYKTSTACHVITSGANGEFFVKEISSSPNVAHIYVFCRVKDFHSDWAKSYSKISCVETNIEKILSQIQHNLLEWYKEKSSLKLNLPAFAPIFDERDKSHMNHLHLYLKVIPNFKNREQAKKDFLALSRGIYSDFENKQEITRFQNDYNGYSKEKTLKWYSKDSFFYRVVNNGLRTATSDSIQFCRLPLKDMETAIKEQYQTKSKYFSGSLYRGSYLSEEEWENLKANLNQEIEMHGFLSVSKEEKVALNFMRADPSKKVFITILVPKGPNEDEQGFAEIEEFSQLPDEKEVLFNVRSRFTVLETEEKYSQKLPYRHLVLLYGAQGFRRFMAQQNPVQEISIKNLKETCCDQYKASANQPPEKMLFLPILNTEKQSSYCKDCLDSTITSFLCIPSTENSDTFSVKGFMLVSSSQKAIPFFGYQCCLCDTKKQKMYFQCTECGEREKIWCEKCFNSELECITGRHTIIAESNPFSFWCQKMPKNELDHLEYQNNQVPQSDNLFQQPEMYLETEEFNKAIEYYEIYIKNNEGKGNDSNLATCYKNLGFAHENVGEYEKALKYYILSLNIFTSLYGENHPQVVSSYSNLGVTSENLGDYDKTLEYYFKALNIGELVYGKKHPKIAALSANIGLVYFNLDKFKKALEYFLQSLEIFQSVDGESHPNVAKCYNHIGNAYNAQGKYDMALEYHLKSLNIRKLLHGEIHHDVGTSYNNLGIAYDNKGQYGKAVEYYMKGLNIRKIVYGENHQDVGRSYNNLGEAYEHQGNNSQAEEYYMKFMRTEEETHGKNHPFVAIAYNNFGGFLGDQGKHEEALEYCQKALKIRKSVYKEKKHSDLAISYNTLGEIYQKLREDNKALKYYLKAIEIFESVHEESHPDTAMTYRNLGSFYEDQKDYGTAQEYYLKSLDMLKSIHGEIHPEVASSYNQLGSVYNMQGDYEKARECFRKSLDIFESGGSEESPLIVAASYHGLGSVYENHREYEKALKYFMQALEKFNSTDIKNHPETRVISSKIEAIISIIENQHRN